MEKKKYYHKGYKRPKGYENHFVLQQENMVIENKLPCNMLTVTYKKSPEYYMKLVRHHLKNNADTITLQALGQSTPHLIQVACLVQIKNYGVFKKIKNDHLTVPIADQNGAHVGMIKKIRLTVKITKSQAFGQIIEEEQKQRVASSPTNEKNPDHKEADKACSPAIEEVFDKEDLQLKPADIMDQLLKDIPIREDDVFFYNYELDHSDGTDYNFSEESQEDSKEEKKEEDESSGSYGD